MLIMIGRPSQWDARYAVTALRPSKFGLLAL